MQWTYDQLKEMLIKICDDIECCKGPVSYFEMPPYLIDFWKDNNKEYYDNLEKQKRYKQYLDLHKEFGIKVEERTGFNQKYPRGD